jgi:hypothetical protein
MAAGKFRCYFLPEWQGCGPHFFARNALLLSEVTETISGYRLWALGSALNNCLAPFKVVASHAPGYESKFYKVQFPDGLPELSNLGLSESDSIICMNDQELIKHQDAIPVPFNDWGQSAFMLETFGALRVLNVIPEVSIPLIQDRSSMANLELSLKRTYEINLPIGAALQRIHSDAVFGLSLFGFLATSDPDEASAAKYADDLRKQNFTPDYNCWFCLGGIQWAIRKYHSKAFDRDQLFTAVTFKALRNSVKLVAEVLRHLNYPVQDDNLYPSLLRSLSYYQGRLKLNETFCGEKTLRSLLFECDRGWLLKVTGFPQSKTRERLLQIEKSHSEVGEVREVLEKLPLVGSGQEEMEKEIVSTVGNCEYFCQILKEKVGGCERRLKHINTRVKELCERNSIVKGFLEQTEDTLEVIMNEDDKKERMLLRLRDQNFWERRQNRSVVVLGGLVILLVMIVFVFRPITYVFK